MKTTINIDDSVRARLRREAARLGKTMSELVETALRLMLRHRPPGSPPVAGNLWHDAMTAILMREHGISTIYTRDADFHRFPFLHVVDPLEE